MDQRLLPVRCYSCNKLLQLGWDALRSEARAGVRPDAALDAAGYLRVCCRRMLLTQPIPLQAVEDEDPPPLRRRTAEPPPPPPVPEEEPVKRETTTSPKAKAARRPRRACS
jgi:DNA-directed RNA polymerase subunit N (RpoN/RPB10)